MQATPTASFRACVTRQIELLNAGQPLEAFDQFFAADGIMYANDQVFARSAEEGHRKQERYVLAAKLINGLIVDLKLSEANEICVFRNKTSFVTADDVSHQIDGLCWQRWHDGRIVEERYYDGELMQQLLADGILSKPEMLNK